MTVTEELIIVFKHVNPKTLTEAIVLADMVAKDYFMESEVRDFFNNINK